MQRIREKLAARGKDPSSVGVTQNESKAVEGANGVFVTFGGFVQKDGSDAHV
jgi:hypothetical protein